MKKNAVHENQNSKTLSTKFSSIQMFDLENYVYLTFIKSIYLRTTTALSAYAFGKTRKKYEGIEYRATVCVTFRLLFFFFSLSWARNKEYADTERENELWLCIIIHWPRIWIDIGIGLNLFSHRNQC